MPRPYTSLVIDAPVEQVWAVVRQFNGLPAWHPVIASSSLDSGEEGQVGAVRRLVTGDGVFGTGPTALRDQLTS